MSLILAVIGYAILALVLVSDKFILTRSLREPALYTFYSTVFLLGVVIAYPFGVEWLRGVDWVWALVSGFAFGGALWTMFIAVSRTEATHMNPFIAAMTAIATYLMAQTFFAETLTRYQHVGVVVLVMACMLLSFEVTSRGHGLSRHYVWGVLSGVLFAVSHVAAKYLYIRYPFLTGFVWTRFPTGLLGLGLLLLPTVRARLRAPAIKSPDHRNTVLLIVANKVGGVVSAVMVQVAIAIGSVTVVNALVGVQFALIFGIIYTLSAIRPEWIKEYFTRGEIISEIIAIMLIITGTLLLVPGIV